MAEGMRPDGWVPINAGQVPDGWVLIVAKWNDYVPPAILRAWWDRNAPIPHWNHMGGRLSDGATVLYWRPLPELPEDMK